MSLFAKGPHPVVFLAGNWKVVNKGDKVPAKTICFLSYFSYQERLEGRQSATIGYLPE